jgi:hypothetical protein
MRLNPSGKLFIGIRIDNKLREALAQATPGDQHYFKDPDSPYLRVLPHAEDQWIGKVLDSGLPPGDLEDIQRNVLSILSRVAPGVRCSASSLRLFVLDETPGVIPNL